MTTIVAIIFALLLQHPEERRPCADLQQCAELAIDIGLAVHDAHVLTGVPEEYLLAIAWLESGLDRTRHGRLGRGLWGLNPRSVAYRYAVDAIDAGDDPLAVQARVAARYLAFERRRCGSWGAALRSYGSGKCKPTEGGDRYLSRWRRALRHVRAVGQIEGSGVAAEGGPSRASSTAGGGS